MKKYGKKLTALLLCICMLGTCCDFTVFASETGSQYETEESAEEDEKTIYKTADPDAVRVEELEEERTKDSTTWLMSDGTEQIEIYAAPVRFSENGELVDYDQSLVKYTEDDDYAYTSAQSDNTVLLPKNLNENSPVVLERGDYSVSVTPVSEETEVDELISCAEQPVTSFPKKRMRAL